MAIRIAVLATRRLVNPTVLSQCVDADHDLHQVHGPAGSGYALVGKVG